VDFRRTIRVSITICIGSTALTSLSGFQQSNQ